jgi:DnaJ-class molecular chaperone
MAAKSDYYDILGVDKSASQEEIKKSYRKQALEWHPDKHKDDKEAAEKRFKQINEAYQILSDPQKRSAYDQYGHQAFSPGGMPGAGYGGFGEGQSPFGGTWKVYTSSSGESPFSGFDFGDPFDIFEQFFGGASPYRSSRVSRYSIDIDFIEAVRGTEKDVVIDGKKKKIKIPAGVDEGSQIKFSDFVLSVNIKPHDVFERDGADIYINQKIPFSLAVLGGSLNVPTLDGDVKIQVRPGTQSGTMIRLRGRGVPVLRGRGRGDQYIKVSVLVPDKLNREQKKAIGELKDLEM